MALTGAACVLNVGENRARADFNYQFQCLPGRVHADARTRSTRTGELKPPGKDGTVLRSGYAAKEKEGWPADKCDVVVSWKGPGPNREQLKEFCSKPARVRFIIFKTGNCRDFEQNEANVRYATIQEAKRAAKELHGKLWPEGSCFPHGCKMTVRWALSEDSWGGKPKDLNFWEDMAWNFVEYEPKTKEEQRRTMNDWRSGRNGHGGKEFSDYTNKRHGIPAFDWSHDQTACLSLHNVSKDTNAFVQANMDNPVFGPAPVYGDRPIHRRGFTEHHKFGPGPLYETNFPSRISPQGHPRLRNGGDGEAVWNLPYHSQGEDELAPPWELEIT